MSHSPAQSSVTSQVFPVNEESQIAMVRRAAVSLANEGGMNETEVGKVAIIATEAARNLVRYAHDGQILLRPLNQIGIDAPTGLEFLVLDKGPGMGDVARSLRDGFSTGGTSGTGLGAIRRLASQFDIFSQPDKGTVMVAQCFPENVGVSNAEATAHASAPSSLLVGSVNLPIRGETACGDAWALGRRDGCDIFMVCDGLGHGPLAADASKEAIRMFRHVVGESPTYIGPAQIIEAAHGAMRATRGAAIAVTEVNQGRGIVRFAGIGNIAASLYNLAEDRKMASLGGIVGAEMRKVQEFSYPWSASTTLIMHSDGINTHWALQRYPGLVQRHPSLTAGVLYRDFLRGRDDATVLVAQVA